MVRRGYAYLKFLDTLIQNAKSDCCAATEKAIAYGDEVEHLRDYLCVEFLHAKGNAPIGLSGGKGEHGLATSDFTRLLALGGLELQSARATGIHGGRFAAEIERLFFGGPQTQRLHSKGAGKFAGRFLEHHLHRLGPENAAGVKQGDLATVRIQFPIH